MSTLAAERTAESMIAVDAFTMLVSVASAANDELELLELAVAVVVGDMVDVVVLLFELLLDVMLERPTRKRSSSPTVSLSATK